MWQDAIITSGSIAFLVALVPALLSRKDKPPVLTSLMTSAILLAYGFAYMGLGLWSAAIGVITLSLAWATLAVQKAANEGERKGMIDKDEEAKKRIPNPGSDEALDQGCECPILDNGHGRRPDPAFGGWVIAGGCPLHDPTRRAR